MPTRIELLKQAGFSDAEIGDWATSERRRMQGAGFTDNEIDDEFGVTRPPQEVPAAFIERLKRGNALHRILGAAGEYAQHYFGDEPLGFSPENKEALRKLGVVGDIIVPAAKPVDALLRAVPAGIAGLGAGLGQAVEEGHDAALGPSPYAKGKAARDFAQLAQIAALLWGASRPKAGATRVPAANDTPASALPRAEDFRNAAAAISGTPRNSSKLPHRAEASPAMDRPWHSSDRGRGGCAARPNHRAGHQVGFREAPRYLCWDQRDGDGNERTIKRARAACRVCSG